MSKSQEFWDKSANNYDKTEKRFEFIHHKSRESAKRYLSASDVVLDYGCGTGTTACEFASLVNNVQAIDISPKMVDIAKGKARDAAIQNIEFDVADIFDDRFKRQSFDKIFAFNMLHTISEPAKVVRRINELLKPDGLFVSVTPCLRDKMSFVISAQIQIMRLLCLFGVIPIPIRRLVSSDIDELISGGGFQAVCNEQIFQGASSYFVAAKKAT